VGFSLKRLARKAVRGIGKLGKPVLAGAIASNPVTAAGARAVTNLKAAAVATKAARLKVQPVSVRANVSKMAVPSPGATIAGPKGLIAARGGSRKSRRRSRASSAAPDFSAIVAAATGAPAKSSRKRVTKSARAKAPKAAKPMSAAKARAKAKNKAMYAAWKAEGKPGRFIDWAKVNRKNF